MRLKKLEVFGFKSFFDKTVVAFQPGVNGIVGPNGCGKSNLSDAILWVLGEQSPKNLRGEKMEDVIFNGTEHRKALAVAEVSLTVGDIAKELPPPYTPYGELTFSRRLYRSGESEYLINKSPCRLKDIRDLLIDMGAGYKAHTIIEQGRVDDMITASPLQRRELVEEAAGIAKYRLRKAEALRKLDHTEQNLLRVRDIIDELRRQRSGLDRQARKAEKYKGFRETLKTLELQLAEQEWAQWNTSRTALAENEKSLQDQRAERASQLAELDLKHTETKTALTEKDALLGQANIEASEMEGRIQRLEGKIETLHAQRKEWLEAQAQSTLEITRLEEGIAALVQEADQLEKEASDLALALPEKEAALAKNEAESQALQEKGRIAFDDIEQQKTDLFHIASLLSNANNNLLHFQVQKEALHKQQERRSLEREELSAKSAEAETSLKQRQAESLHTSEILGEKKARQEAVLALIGQTEDALDTKEGRLLGLKEELAAAKAEADSRKHFYRGLLEKKEGSENRFLELGGLKGMMADLIEVPARYERAAEALLGARLQGIVLGDQSEIKKGMRLLREGQMGRGVFFPSQARVSGPASSEAVSGAGLVGEAKDLLSFRGGYESLSEALLSSVFFVNDLDAAFQLWERFPKVEAWVTLEGEVLDHYGIVSGGREQDEKGVLVQKREIQSLMDQIDVLKKEMALLEAEIESDVQALAEAKDELESLSESLRTLSLEKVERENDQKVLSSEVDRYARELETLQFEEEEHRAQVEELIQKEESEQALIVEKRALKEEMEAELEKKQQELNTARAALNTLNEAGVQLRMMTSALKEKSRHTQEKQDRVRTEHAVFVRRKEEQVGLQNALQEKLGIARSDEEKAVASIEQLSTEREARIAQIRAEQEIHASLISRLQALDTESASLRKALSETQDGLQDVAVKKVEVEMNLQKITEAVAMNYQIDIASYHSTEDMPPLEEAKAQSQSLRAKLDEMGPVNMTAIEEYRELDERYQFLTTQEADLLKSIEGLREAITKINKTTRGLFVDTFHLLNQKFGEVFTSFFGGGTAALILLDEAHPLESGIDLLVQLPGKGKRTITLLSGGEKALSAISLLLATFLIHPTPFCLLDEIDAPLDEENTRRFTQTILKMSEQTQFIIVTHNKLSMEIADVLYGVTMEETGISKLVSVNLSHVAESKEVKAQQPAESPEPALR